MRITWLVLVLVGMVFPRLSPLPGSAGDGGGEDCCQVAESADCCLPDPVVQALACCDEEVPQGPRIVEICPCGGHGPSPSGVQTVPDFVMPPVQGFAHSAFAPWGPSTRELRPRATFGKPSSPPPRA